MLGGRRAAVAHHRGVRLGEDRARVREELRGGGPLLVLDLVLGVLVVVQELLRHLVEVVVALEVAIVVAGRTATVAIAVDGSRRGDDAGGGAGGGQRGGRRRGHDGRRPSGFRTVATAARAVQGRARGLSVVDPGSARLHRCVMSANIALLSATLAASSAAASPTPASMPRRSSLNSCERSSVPSAIARPRRGRPRLRQGLAPFRSDAPKNSRQGICPREQRRRRFVVACARGVAFAKIGARQVVVSEFVERFLLDEKTN